MMAFGSKCLRKADGGKVLKINTRKRKSKKAAARRSQCEYVFSVAKNIAKLAGSLC